MRGALLVVCLLAATARADDKPRWYQGPHGTNRIVHLTLTGFGLVLYPATQFVEDDVECRWCGGPNAIDRSVRNSLVWSDTSTPAQLSNITGYVISPTLAFGLTLAGTLGESPTTAGLIDDLVPIAESMVVTQWVTRAIKVGAARTRPYAHFTGPIGDEDNLSFPSGHTSRAFSLATSAGMIAHLRNYKIEPYIWASGMTFAAFTGYLRIGADRHYLSDVLVGASIGVAAGLTVPFLMRRTNASIVPTANGIAVVGGW